MHPLVRLPVCALAVIAALAHAQAAPITLRVLAQESIPPKWIVGRGKLTGLCPDILAAIEKVEPGLRFARELETRSLPFLKQGLASGAIDGARALLESERRRQIAVIAGPPLYTVKHRLAARRDDRTTVSSMAELVRLKPLINTQRSAAYAAQLRTLGLQVDDSNWVVKEEPIYFHVSRKTPLGARQLLDRALFTLKNNGELARIHASWARAR
ncbi:transporter substrate-binding domain-containing protein [Massilia sp. TWP1-3-3]|uniref:transporter substrate-binding domain-containing protein n=1 Tax=Massilia sp. TWP1-3-3 TaxID=2804573 RepID=UPI003CEE383B